MMGYESSEDEDNQQTSLRTVNEKLDDLLDRLANQKQGSDKWQDHKCNVEDVRLEAKSDIGSQFNRQRTKKEKRRE